jgi:hypothetical protein
MVWFEFSACVGYIATPFGQSRKYPTCAGVGLSPESIVAETNSSDKDLKSGRRRGAYGHRASLIFGASVSAVLTFIAYGAFLRHGVAPAVVGYNLVPAERVLSGQIPYRDFIYNYTPGVLWLNAVLFRFLGVSLMSARLGVYLAKAASAVLLYMVAGRYLSKWAALLPVLMMLAWIGYGDLLKVFPTQYGMPLLLAAWLCALNAAEAGAGRKRNIWLMAAGSFAGLVFIFKQNVGVFAFAATCGAAIISPWPPGLTIDSVIVAIKRCLVVVVGFSAPAAAMCLYLFAHSAFTPMLSHFLHHAVAYEEAKGIALPDPSVLLMSLTIAAVVAAIIIPIYRTSRQSKFICLGLIFVTLLGFVVWASDNSYAPAAALYRSLIAEVYYLPIYAAGVAVVMILGPKRFGRFRHSPELGIGAFFALAAFLEIFPRSDADHLARVLPGSFVMACALLVYTRKDQGEPSSFTVDAATVSSLNTNNRAVHLRGVILTGICLLTIVLGIKVTWNPQFDAGLQFHDRAPLLFERGAGVMDVPSEAAMLNDLVSFIQSSTSPNDPILAVSRKITCLYFFAARPNTTRLLWFDSPGVPVADREDIYSRVSARQFKLIVFGADLAEMSGPERGGSERSEISRHQKQLLDLVRQYYHQAAVINGVTCFSPKS